MDEKARPHAPRRQHGHATEPRHRGVFHEHRQRGWHPHPHSHAARRRRLEQARDDPGAGTVAGAAAQGDGPRPLHHHQHRISARHERPTRRTAPATEIGHIAAYDAAQGTAMVQLLGSPARLVGPVPVTACAPRDLALVGCSCLVVLLDAYNPADGVVAAVWPGQGAASGAKLMQVGVAALGVTGSTTASLPVAFPMPYAGPPVVVATATDPAWRATVGAITATGFTLTAQTAAPATGTVAVEWMACGV